MPKEYVRASGLTSDSQDCAIAVGWDRYGFVQLATLRRDESVHPNEGMYVDVDRDQINDLIRKLRRARDQAFGRDE